LIGSIKLQVSFAKEPCKRDDILQKRPIILRSLLTIATPYTHKVQTLQNRPKIFFLKEFFPKKENNYCFVSLLALMSESCLEYMRKTSDSR